MWGQGREADVVIFSCVRAHDSSAGGVGFVADVRRMNVAITRAQCAPGSASPDATLAVLILAFPGQGNAMACILGHHFY